MQRQDSKHDMSEEGKSEKRMDVDSKIISRPGSVSSSNAKKESVDDAPSTGKRSPSQSINSEDFVPDSWKRQDTFNSDSGISVSSSPEIMAHLGKATDNAIAHANSGSDSSSDSDSDSDGSDSDSDSDDEKEYEDTRPSPTARLSSGTVTDGVQHSRTLPDNDPVAMHLRRQEEEMRQHILHSPQPRRSLRNQAPATLEPSSPLPLYDHRVPSVVPHGFPIPPPPAPNVPHVDPSMMYPPFYQPMLHHLPQDVSCGFDMKRTTIAGYELLASKLVSRKVDDTDVSVPPVYRRFEHLNHRVLLHLQDEISELEEELRILDESVAQMTPSTERNVLQPASRRAEARYGSDLHFRRTEILGRVFVKLGQYST
jgi:hypothetical protein